MADSPMDTRITDHLLSTTRAVRKRLDLERPVEREVLLECLRLAVQSPTGSNSQNWHWVVVTDPEKRARLKELYDGMARPYLESQAEHAADPQTKRVYQSAVYLLNVLDRVPVHVIPCVEGRLDNPEPFAAASFYGSILPAVWSFMLAARSRGLGTAWTTLHLANEAETAELLGIPDGMTQVALIPVAYTKGTDFRPGTRKPFDDFVHWNGW
jgi:nitroreductase